MYGHDIPFTTDNYNLTTTPKDEYGIATGKKECPEAAKKDQRGNIVREVKPLAALRALPATEKAGLADMEIIAVVCAPHLTIQFPLQAFILTASFFTQVLYSGPMFQVTACIPT